MTGLVFLHGWGFGPEIWQQLAKAFPYRPLAVFNSGYFGPQQMALPANPDGWIGVGHSLGFARLLAMDVPWRGLIGLGAFLRFCPCPGRDAGTPANVLSSMTARLDLDAADVLRRFLRRCGLKAPQPSLPNTEGLVRLRQDLTLLRDLDLCTSLPLLASPPPVLLLHAADDRIAPLALAHEAHEVLPGSQLHVFDSGAHALPLTRPDDCLGPIQELLRATA
jgi:pimeloyl-[acyl-carrier protein] methyl ester esterase